MEKSWWSDLYSDHNTEPASYSIDCMHRACSNHILENPNFAHTVDHLRHSFQSYTLLHHRLRDHDLFLEGHLYLRNDGICLGPDLAVKHPSVHLLRKHLRMDGVDS